MGRAMTPRDRERVAAVLAMCGWAVLVTAALLCF